MTAQLITKPVDMASELGRLQTVILSRRKGLRARFFIAILGTSIVTYVAGWQWALFYALIVALTQTADHLYHRRFLKTDRSANPTRWERVCTCALSVFTATAYTFMAAIVWFALEGPGQAFALTMVCGALLHIAIHQAYHRPSLICSAASHSAYLFGLPLYSGLVQQSVPIDGMVLLLMTGAMFVMHLIAANTTYQEISNRLRRANEQAEEARAIAEQANRAKSEFLATMSHELRTPMNGVLGMARVLASDPKLTTTQRVAANTIEESGEVLLSLLNDLLDLSKIEAGYMEVTNQPFSLEELVEALNTLFAARADELELDLTIRIDESLPDLLMGDELRIRQVLSNLLSNALKFTEDGEVELRVGGEKTEAGVELVMSVRDTGCGIPEDVQGRLFESFVQLHNSRQMRAQGTGLGLAISRRLIRMMGGEITVDSTPGEGSVFTVTLTLEEAAGEARLPQQGSQAAAANEISERQLRVLTVDDNAANRRVVEAFLSHMDIDIWEARDGSEALDLLERMPFDLVLMDIQMPVMDGITATEKLRQGHSDNRDVPLIALTANAMSGHEAQCRAAGMNDFVTKPIAPEQLFQAMVRVLQDADASADLALQRRS
jgi:signal transduction histidine kinase/CheY-like chemotaxis protein